MANKKHNNFKGLIRGTDQMGTIAQALLWFELLTISISTFFYYRFSKQNQNRDLLSIARFSYWGFTILTSLISIILFYLIISHDFRFDYIIQYSSINLPFKYLISSFWAGQEGSFLLWVLIASWLGIILIYKTPKPYLG